MSPRVATRYWDRYAARYDASMKLFGGALPEMLDGVARAVHGAGEVLEVGAGTGLATVVIARQARHVVATDLSRPMLDELQGRLRQEHVVNVEVACTDAEALPFRDEQFDAVVAANLLHLVPDLGAALRGMTRVLRPGGVLVVPTYCHGETMRARIVSRALSLTGFPGKRRLTLSTLANAVRDAGLEVREERLLAGLLPIGFVSARRSA